MQILYDGQIYSLNPTGGISRYFANIISRLPDSIHPTLSAIHPPNCFSYPNQVNLHRIEFPGFRPYRWCNTLAAAYFRSRLTYRTFDLAHPTYYSLATHRIFKNYSCPIVLTVHDMIHELFAEQVDRDGQHAALKRQAILAADAILCVSHNTKKDLLERYAISEDRITVTYLASSLDVRLSYGTEPVPDRPYYLYVGSRDRYKNFDGLLQAFSKAISTGVELVLCVVGQPFRQAELKRIEELNLSHHIQHYGYASDSQLAKLYRCSVALVYPSLYEGFGIPPLEAMACQTVVVAANSSSIPEVVGGAGILFDPTSIGDLADILLMLLNQPGDRQRLIAQATHRASLFSWEQTVAQTVEVYRSYQ